MRYDKKINLRKGEIIIFLIIIILIIAVIFLFPAKEKGEISIEARTRYDERSLVEARNYQKLEDNLVQCNLCFRGCIIKEGKRGTCRNRANINGKIYAKIANRKGLYYKAFRGRLRNFAYMSKFLLELWFTPRKLLFFTQNFTISKSESSYL